ncbi:hypothetical protein BDN70DRAFT_888424 [Pholiota conissans]|uniref:Uncharacterized protein n=1 Tax=Pholiota conissans TaxID=109636 RepID=A0A9P5YM68_9AGAR|nr:hypothetical protein BDN70DRAFT_888424 [Pholiota conissans]
MGIPAAAVNGDTWSESLHEKLKDGAFQGILASPEINMPSFEDFSQIPASRESRLSQLIKHTQILHVEKSTFERQKRKRRGLAQAAGGRQDDSESDCSDDELRIGDNNNHVEGEEAQYEWQKVDDALRKWIEANECRRSIAGKNFNNPIEDRPAPTHICCNNCSSIALDASSIQERLSTPEPIERSDDDETDVSSTPSTPSKSANGNRKRIMAQPQPSKPSRRRGPHLALARLSLQKWRVNAVRNSYTPGPFLLTVHLCPIQSSKCSRPTAKSRRPLNCKPPSIGHLLNDMLRMF